jgi:hypothetical protein
MVMSDALHVRPNESALACSLLHEDWNERIGEAAAQLASLEATLLLSNIPYLSIAAANKAGVPAIAVSSLNWADVFHHYCGHLPGAKLIWQQMVDAYATAQMFLQLAPAMPMPSICNGRAVGPVARHPDRATDYTLAALGRVRLVVGSSFEFSHPDARSSAELGFPIIDLVRSCEVVISKPGYGVVTEAACNGVPILLVSRPQWPEEASFREWLACNGRALTR